MPDACPIRSEMVSIRSISADPANLRKHGERSIEAIMASLRRFGQQKPVVLDRNHVVIAGNGTLEAARRLGWKRIAIVRSRLQAIDRTAYAIADNRTAELSEWDQEALSAVLGALPGDALDATGFSAQDIEGLQSDQAESSGGLNEVPEPPPLKDPVTRRGDLWQLGDHLLLCGDCTDDADVRRLMGRDRAVLFATDPPYLVGYDGTNHPQSFTGGANKDWSGTYGTTWDDADGNTDLYDKFISAAVRLAIRENAAWYCWHASRRQAMLEAAWIKAGAFVHCQIVWAKNRPVLTRTWYMWQHEPCLFGWIKSKKPPRVDAETLSTVWAIDTIPNGEERPDHPTPKPLEVFAIPMRQHTKAGEICYEPFSGSGTQIVTAEQLGRRCRALEIEPRYVDVAVQRWQTLTGNAARLVGDGRSWLKVAAARRVRIQPCRPDPDAPADTRAAAPSSPPATAMPTPPSTPVSRGRRRSPPRRPGATGPAGRNSGGSSSPGIPSAPRATVRRAPRSTTS